MNNTQPTELKNWIPWRMARNLTPPSCEWLYVGEKLYTEPFFDETITVCRRALGNEQKNKVVSSLGMMTQWAEGAEAVTPSALIFHVSRCGSTLLSQLLGCDPLNIVLSEVPFFDEVLRLPLKEELITPAESSRYLEAAIRLYGQKRTPEQQRLFIKTDSWHLHFYEQLRTLYPSIPFILLYRHPCEVMHSQQKQRGWQSVPGLIEPQVFGFTGAQLSEVNPDRYMANVLASYYTKMIRIAGSDPLAFPFNYAGGINTLAEKMYSLIDLTPEKGLAEQMEQRCSYHAKRPQELFLEETHAASIPGYLEPAFQAYQELEELSALAPSRA